MAERYSKHIQTNVHQLCLSNVHIWWLCKSESNLREMRKLPLFVISKTIHIELLTGSQTSSIVHIAQKHTFITFNVFKYYFTISHSLIFNCLGTQRHCVMMWQCVWPKTGWNRYWQRLAYRSFVCRFIQAFYDFLIY